MKKQVIVLSLGGSLIIPEDVDYRFLEKFKKLILKHTKNKKFVIVCGGGSIARKYIHALSATGKNETFQSFAGIGTTRMNARFMSYFFGINPHLGIPHTLETLEKDISKENTKIIFCGALEYKPHQTSDSTAAQIAAHFKTIFINLSNVSGLHDKNPLEYKDAKFIPEITWSDFYKMANKLPFKPGQHFVLDQHAAGIILKNKITTYLLGKELTQLDNLLKNKKFKGTVITR